MPGIRTLVVLLVLALGACSDSGAAVDTGSGDPDRWSGQTDGGVKSDGSSSTGCACRKTRSATPRASAWPSRSRPPPR